VVERPGAWPQANDPESLGRRHVKTMMIYTHVLRRGFSIRRPVDAL
jgi:hypothetical protein